MHKIGPGTLTINATSYWLSTYTGPTTVSAGVLQADDGLGLPAASFLTLDGAVLQSNAAATFNRPLGSSGQAFQWTDSHSAGFAGGFAGGGGPLTVNIGGAGTTLSWGVSYVPASWKLWTSAPPQPPAQ